MGGFPFASADEKRGPFWGGGHGSRLRGSTCAAFAKASKLVVELCMTPPAHSYGGGLGRGLHEAGRQRPRPACAW